MRVIKSADLAVCAMFAALSAVLSQVSLPIGLVPVNLTHLSVFVAAGLFGAKRGVISQTVFVLLGLFGVPVFSGFSGGIGVVAGPTGGFIAGYIACAFVVGIISGYFGKSVGVMAAAMAAGMIVTYTLGVMWFMFTVSESLSASLSVCVVPFLPGDLLKISAGAVLVPRLAVVMKRKI